jgi:hypothetical protein
MIERIIDPRHGKCLGDVRNGMPGTKLEHPVDGCRTAGGVPQKRTSGPRAYRRLVLTAPLGQPATSHARHTWLLAD